MRRSHAWLMGAVAAGVALAATSVAHAQTRGPAARAPVEAPFAWTGFYGGANLGIHWVDAGRTTATAADAGTAAPFVGGLGGLAGFCAVGFCDLNFGGGSGTGAIGGLQVGFNHALNGLLVGIEADIDGSTAGVSRGSSARGIGCCGLIGPPWHGAATTNVEWMGTIRARLGALVSPTLLAYITGGFAYAQVERTYGGTFITNVGAVVGNVAYLGRSRDIDTGWTGGAGLEWAITNRVTLGAEYLYVALDGGGRYRAQGALPFGGPVGSPLCTASSCNLNVRGDDVDNHIARLKVNYKF